MTRGRKAIPTQVHILQGTFRRDRHADTPQPKEGMLPAPAHLDKAAKVEYRRVGKLLAATHVLTEADQAALSCYAVAWSRMIEAEGKLRETGLVVKSPAGFPCVSPFHSIARQAAEDIRRWSVELGLTPSSRTKIKTPPADTATQVSHRTRGAS